MHCFTDNQSKGGSVRLACLCLMILLKMLSSLFQRTLCENAFGLPFGPMRMSPCLVLPPGMVPGSSESVTHPRSVHVLMSCPWRCPDPSSRPPPPLSGHSLRIMSPGALSLFLLCGASPRHSSQPPWSELIYLCFVTSVRSDSGKPMDHSPPGSSVHGISQAGMMDAVGCHFLLQGIFLTQESKQCLLHCRQILYR